MGDRMTYVVKFDPFILGELPWFADISAASADEARSQFEEAAAGQLDVEYVATEGQLAEKLTGWVAPTDDAADVIPSFSVPMGMFRRVGLELVRQRAAKLAEERGA